MWQVVGRAFVVLAGAVLAASFAGEMHGLGDSLAVFRPVLICGVIACGALVWRWRGAQILMAAAVVLAGLHGVAIVGKTTHAGQADVVVYQKNMLFRGHDRSELIADIRSVGADIVALQEVSRVNQPMLDRLRGTYPHQLLCNGHAVGAVAILSKTPLDGQDCSNQHGFARAVTTIDGQQVQVFAIHLHWPWPYGQRDHLQRILQNMVPLAGAETIVAGDFNMVASGRPIAWVERELLVERVGALVKTFELFGYPIGIDHVLASGRGGDLDVRPKAGSDHYGVVAQIYW